MEDEQMEISCENEIRNGKRKRNGDEQRADSPKKLKMMCVECGMDVVSPCMQLTCHHVLHHTCAVIYKRIGTYQCPCGSYFTESEKETLKSIPSLYSSKPAENSPLNICFQCGELIVLGERYYRLICLNDIHETCVDAFRGTPFRLGTGDGSSCIRCDLPVKENGIWMGAKWAHETCATLMEEDLEELEYHARYEAECEEFRMMVQDMQDMEELEYEAECEASKQMEEELEYESDDLKYQFE